MRKETTNADEGRRLPHSGKRVELCRDRKAIFLCREQGRCYFDIHEVRNGDSLVAIHQFECTFEDLEAVSSGRAMNVETAHGHLLVRLSREQVWIVVAVPSEHFSESSLIDLPGFEQALNALATD